MDRLREAAKKAEYESVYKTLQNLKSISPEKYSYMDDSYMQYKAKSEAENLANSLIGMVKRLSLQAKKDGANLILSDVEHGAPPEYRRVDGEITYGVYYKGIYPSPGKEYDKNPRYNPRSKTNREYTKKYGQQKFELRMLIPQKYIDYYRKRKHI